MKLITGVDYFIPMTPELTKHFDNPYNYTREIMQQFDDNYYRDILKPGDVLLDIGANIGLFALHASPYFHHRIICVEPTPSHFELLTIMARAIRGVELENSALAGHTGTVKFHSCGINSTMNSLQPRGDKSFDVPCITLDDLLKKYRLNTVDFCKVDIEGSEDVAITVETLRPVADKIKKFFIELHPPNNESQNKWKAIFEEVGYKVEKYVHDSLICTR